MTIRASDKQGKTSTEKKYSMTFVTDGEAAQDDRCRGHCDGLFQLGRQREHGLVGICGQRAGWMSGDGGLQRGSIKGVGGSS